MAAWWWSWRELIERDYDGMMWWKLHVLRMEQRKDGRQCEAKLVLMVDGAE